MSDEKENKTEGQPKKYELKVSRMDPLNTYSASALAMQLAEVLENAANFQEDADAFYEQAKAERLKAKKLQVLIKKVHERDKLREAEAK